MNNVTEGGATVNLNTSYVEVKLMNNVTEGGATVNLNTSYVEVKL